MEFPVTIKVDWTVIAALSNNEEASLLTLTISVVVFSGQKSVGRYRLYISQKPVAVSLTPVWFQNLDNFLGITDISDKTEFFGRRGYNQGRCGKDAQLKCDWRCLSDVDYLHFRQQGSVGILVEARYQIFQVGDGISGKYTVTSHIELEA